MKVIGVYGALDWDANNFNKPNTYIHDAGATLFVNGKHVRSINEERLTRIKDEGNYPRKSIEYVLGEYAPEDIDIVCYVPSFPEISNEQLTDHTAKRMLRESFPNAEVWMLSHHLCHAASAVFTAPSCSSWTTCTSAVGRRQAVLWLYGQRTCLPSAARSGPGPCRCSATWRRTMPSVAYA